MIRGGNARSIPTATKCRKRRTTSIRNSTRTGKTIGWLRISAEVTGRRFRVRLSRRLVGSSFMRLCVWKEHARMHAGGRPRILCGGDAGVTDGSGRRRGDCAAADAGVWRGHSLCDWRFAGFGDCYLVGRGCGVSSRRVFEYARGDVFGNRDNGWGCVRCVPGRVFAYFDYCDCVRRGAALLGLRFDAYVDGSTGGDGAGSNRDDVASGRFLSHGGWSEVLPCAARAAGLWIDVPGRGAIGIAGDRFGRGEGAGDGSSHEDSVQGIDDDQQFYDRRDGGGERGDLSAARIY